MENKLQVRHLRISFRTISGKVQAVRDISFDLHKGETMAIVGESGSGKSVTSKAILGILAGNSIVEGGEILYDGQDLLKIDEDDFYKIRGDKIAMIFQDPLSSLNPIMRIGKQLTEAMILKGKARQRASRDNFNEKLALLQDFMIKANKSGEEKYKKECKMFDTLEIHHIKIEQAYSDALEAATETLQDTEDALFLIEKNALNDAKNVLESIKEYAMHAVNPYVVSDKEDVLKQNVSTLTENLAVQIKEKNFAQAQEKLIKIKEIMQEAVQKEKPDFFAMGYYQAVQKTDVITGTRQEQNAAYKKIMMDEFLSDFIKDTKSAISYADDLYVKRRAAAKSSLQKAIDVLEKQGMEAYEKLVETLIKEVKDSINHLDIAKDSAAYTFEGSVKDFIQRYHLGQRTNGKKQRDYEKQVQKAQRSKGDDYTVAAPSIIDLDLVKENILGVMSRLVSHYSHIEENLQNQDVDDKTIKLIEYFDENASGIVQNVTKQMAKRRAIKLMDEVGIPEPKKRYNQFPFEFSGGMRQRIVIAIALAANPDVLICDEPTTALDVTIQAQILELINRIKKERNLSIIFITHDLGVVANMADRIAVMYAGKIVEYGTSEEIFYAPAHPYTWALLSSMPDLETKEKLEAIPGTPPNMIYPPKGDAFADRNRYAMQIDFEQQPPEFQITDTHWAATWLLHENAPKVEPPKAVTQRILGMKNRMRGENNA